MSLLSTEPLRFNQVTSVKLPRSATYLYNNLIQHNDTVNNISYYAIIHGFEVWIIEHSDQEKLTRNEKHDPSVHLKKVPYDKLDSITCAKWCNFDETLTFVIGTESGIVHVYDFEGKKVLYSHDVNADQKTIVSNTSTNCNILNPSINCIDCNDENLLFVGLSSGALVSFTIDNEGLSNKKQIYQCANKEGINCMSLPLVTNHNVNKHRKLYIGCDSGSVIQYDFISAEIDVLIEPSNVNKIHDEIKVDENEITQQNIKQIADPKYVNNCGSCVCIASCDEFVVAGYASGHIKIVQKSELSFAIKQIAMHRRMVTAVAILEEMCLIGTVSEDGYYHIIRNTSSSLEVVRCGSFAHCLLMGIKFVKNNSHSVYNQKYRDKMVALTAYDRNRMVFV